MRGGDSPETPPRALCSTGGSEQGLAASDSIAGIRAIADRAKPNRIEAGRCQFRRKTTDFFKGGLKGGATFARP